MNTIERFWLKVDKSAGDSGCWLWLGGKDKDGYGGFSYVANGVKRRARAHRFAYEIDGRRLGDMLALHSCDVPACVNPAHLRAGTDRENHQDAKDRGRYQRGEAQARAAHDLALTVADVLAIRAAAKAGEAHSSIARRYPVQRRQVSRVVQGTRYAWVISSEAAQ